MKRFTATEKWNKPWFRKLPPKLKCFVQYFFDNCDCAGVWNTDFDLASYIIGEQITESEAIATLGDRIHVLPDGKWWMKGFVTFQAGELNPRCRPHQAILATLKRHGLLTLFEGYSKGIDTPQEQDKEKDKEKDKEGKGCGENQPPDMPPENFVSNRALPPEAPNAEQQTKCYEIARKLLGILNQLTGSTFVECPKMLDPIADSVLRVRYDFHGCKKMIERQVLLWKDDPKSATWLRPSTLFGDQFQSYYGQRELPISPNGKPRSDSHRDEKAAREYPQDKPMKAKFI